MTLMLLIGSSAALVLLFVHAWRTRGRKVTLCFFGFGLLFGILRGNTIWHILRIVEENVDALKPYAPQGGLLPEIGHASIQVAFGWVFAVYLAWTIAELILRRIPRLTGRVFMIGGLSALFMLLICYVMETTAVTVGWWYWTLPTRTRLFGNVNVAGMWAWFSVVHDFLIPFLVIVCSTTRWSRLKWLWVLPYPLHMAGHLGFFLPGTTFNHGAMALFVVVLMFFSRLTMREAGPRETSRGPLSDVCLAAAVVIFFGIVVGANVAAGAAVNLLTAVPLVLLCLLAWRRLPAVWVVVPAMAALSGWWCIGWRVFYALVPCVVYGYLALHARLRERAVLRALPVAVTVALCLWVYFYEAADDVRKAQYLETWLQGDKLAMAGRHEEARKAYQESERHRPIDPIGYYTAVHGMTRLPLTPAGMTMLAHRMPRLVQELVEITRRDPEWTMPREDVSRLYLIRGDVVSAVEQYREMVRQRPKSAPLAAMLGYLLLRDGDLAGGEAMCEQAASSRRPPVEALVNLGVIRFHQGRDEDARVLWQRAMTLESDHSVARLNLARLDETAASRGIDLRFLACSLRPYVGATGTQKLTHVAEIVAMLAVHGGEKDPVEQARLLREALQFDPDYFQGHTNLVRLYVFRGGRLYDPKRALWHARRAVHIARGAGRDAELAEALLLLGRALIASDRPGEARQALSEGRKLAPEPMRAEFDRVPLP